jgi:hypothetical protein
MPQIARDPMTVGSLPLVELSFNTYTRRLPVSFSLFQVGAFEVDFPPKYFYFLRGTNNTATFNFTAVTFGLEAHYLAETACMNPGELSRE